MKKDQLPKTIISPITGDTLLLEEELLETTCAMDYFDDSTEYIEPIAMYRNNDTLETVYIGFTK